MSAAVEETVLLKRWARGVAPKSRAQLTAWLRLMLGVEVPGEALLEGNDSPLDYLCWSFFEHVRAAGPRDAVVWSSRGGGKTFYAAVATVLDLVFKPGVQVKILAGSREQAERMHEHLRRFFARPSLSPLIDGRLGERRGRLLNGSGVEVLAQSHTSVRGTRPHKLRCDEVELFDEDVWQAAQLVTRSGRFRTPDGTLHVAGSVEALSTCHLPGGLMSRLISQPESRRLFRWTAIDMLERCPPSRICESCELRDECGGRAKRAEQPQGRRQPPAGHFYIDDAIVMKSRSDQTTWESEMLCLRPSRRSAVFPEFDPAVHVTDFDIAAMAAPGGTPGAIRWIAGMDFGYRSPAVILWGCADSSGVVRIVAERVASDVLLEAHIAALTSGGGADHAALPVPAWIGVDPAGGQRSEQTGLSPITALRRAGLVVKHRRVPLEDGLRAIRRRLAPMSGPPTLFIHRGCVRLIESLLNYRYPDGVHAVRPVKDGNDHAADALRYLIVNLDAAGRSGWHWY